MDQAELRTHLVNLVAEPDKHQLRALLAHRHIADLSDAMMDFSPKEAAVLLDLLTLHDHAEAFSYMSEERQAMIAAVMPRNDLAALFSQMESDERADLFNRLTEEQRHAVLPGLAQAEREDVRRLASYPEKTAGALMTSDYATLRAHWTVKKALLRIRLEAPDKETIYQVYVVDKDRTLRGTLSLKQLILARPDATIAELMLTDVVSVAVDEDQEKVAEIVRHYDLLAVPVLDAEQKLVGIITYDDAMDAFVEEATEDAQKSASVAALGSSFKNIGLGQLYLKRIGWLLMLVFGALFSGAGIAFFEDIIAQQVALVFFLPLLVGSGGNAGSQAAALMIRALATGEVQMRDWLGLLGREIIVAGALGLTLALAVSALGWLRGGPEVAVIVAAAMVCVVLTGSLIGLCLPFVLSKIKLDPATASGPLVTTIVDATGVIIYLGFAQLVLSGSHSLF
ncbi:magnesium transporter [Simiduia aestuariiviva]|uniref:Magnesium transporter MgtE n=1 Tax=Simiduia aestuariiviva TaxID=1510459 RepID=A0A839UPG5_9GAMM|nr:magnesium transporter [Simiduia aestuariiviva]MBB3167438.1 magnesium transporter [Simiduia aestuariiviva]